MDATLTTHPPDLAAPPVPQHPRLAELVVHLTGCSATLAVAAVNRASHTCRDHDDVDPLAIVASALAALRRIDLRDRPAPRIAR